MKISKNSYFYKFLTLFDKNVFVTYSEWEQNDNGDWHKHVTEHIDTCLVISLTLLNTLISTFIAFVVLFLTCLIGDTIGWIAACILNLSFILPGPLSFLTITISLILGFAASLDYMRKKSNTSSVIMESIAAKTKKMCVKIDLVD